MKYKIPKGTITKRWRVLGDLTWKPMDITQIDWESEENIRTNKNVVIDREYGVDRFFNHALQFTSVYYFWFYIDGWVFSVNKNDVEIL